MDSPVAPSSSSPGAHAAPADVAHRLFQALADRDFAQLAALQHDEVVDDFIALGLVARGKAEVRRFFEDLFAAFPDFRIEVRRITASGETAVVEWEARGAFTGTPFQGIVANGRSVSIRGVDCMRIDGGKLLHNTIYYDGAGFARAVGLLPRMGSAAEKVMTAAFNAATRAKRLLR